LTTSLSGGELQRVALARTLVSNPDVLLLDEPITSLDAKIKKEIRILLREIHRDGIPVIHVTHDYEEAIMLATRIAIIHNGAIIQTGTPLDIFNRPQNDFIANLAGISNFFPATLSGDEKSKLKTARANGLEIKLFCDLSDSDGYIIIPPEQIIISPRRTETSTQNNFYGKITDVYLSAYGYTVTVDIGFKLFVFITVSSFEKLELKSGMNIWVSFKAGAVRFIETDLLRN